MDKSEPRTRYKNKLAQSRARVDLLEQRIGEWVRCSVGCVQMLGERGIKCDGPGMQDAFQSIAAVCDWRGVVLRSVEWAVECENSETSEQWRQCPSCRRSHPNHAPECALDAAIRACQPPLDGLERCWQSLAEVTAERDAIRREHERDIELAARELRIAMPEPGTDLSRLMIANRMLRDQRDKNLCRAVDAEQKLGISQAVLRELVDMAMGWELKHTVAFAKMQRGIAVALGDPFAEHLANQIRVEDEQEG